MDKPLKLQLKDPWMTSSDSLAVPTLYHILLPPSFSRRHRDCVTLLSQVLPFSMDLSLPPKMIFVLLVFEWCHDAR